MTAHIDSGAAQTWERFKNYFFWDSNSNFSLDISRINFQDSFASGMKGELEAAISFMADLEGGVIANPDEKRMVGHYWLRNSEKSPNAEIKAAIDGTLKKIFDFVGAVHSGTIKGATGKNFRAVLVLGIGGSALGPQFVANALGSKNDKLKPYFIDNTDPEGIERAVAALPSLEETVVLVISKSGSTPETRNGMLELKAKYSAAKINHAGHFVAITGEGSQLDKVAVTENWLARFPMWDWVGGRTSEFSAVGLIPAALQGIDISEMLRGAKYMDELTRTKNPYKNPAALLGLAVYAATEGKGAKDMVVLPYRDRLELFSRYLQQLIMESLGKERDLDGKIVHQGIAVYGNKGSTDQHAFVQQLREGIPNFFAVFVEALRDSAGSALEVEPGTTSSDFLNGFYLGTRKALSDNGRGSITVTIQDTSSFNVGMLIALFERFVGIYARLINVNAYHQPGVEAGKKAAAEVLTIQKEILDSLTANKNGLTVGELFSQIKKDPESIFKITEHLLASGRVRCDVKADIFSRRYLLNG
jgi:glucose-6-phosphate isomerase